MEVYLDGGTASVKRPTGSINVISYGIVTSCHGEPVELYGSWISPGKFKADHEVYAYVEAVKYLRDANVKPSDVTFVSDDHDLFTAFHSLHAENYSPSHADRYLKRLSNLCGEYYDNDTYRDCLRYLHESNFIEVKGHHKCVNNLRCDYLAAHARKLALDKPVKMLSFEQWLNRGFIYYVSPTSKHPDVEYDDNGAPFVRWYAAFVSRSIDQLVRA